MAEKEERILVLTTHNEEGECECVTQEGCHANDSCDICNVGMPRQEAIEKMAKILCKRDADYNNCLACSCATNEKECSKHAEELGYFELAEAALDAILSEDK